MKPVTKEEFYEVISNCNNIWTDGIQGMSYFPMKFYYAGKGGPIIGKIEYDCMDSHGVLESYQGEFWCYYIK